MGGHGYFWPKRETWAAEANVCTKTISRATDKFAASGLVAKIETLETAGGREAFTQLQRAQARPQPRRGEAARGARAPPYR